MSTVLGFEVLYKTYKPFIIFDLINCGEKENFFSV